MTKEEMVKMIEARISTEYQKYHNTPVDFIKSAALKIVWTLEADSQLQNKVEERECEHKNEIMYQGDGFVYVKCKDCGIEL